MSLSSPARSLAFHTDLALRRAEGAQVRRSGEATVVTSPHNPSFYWGNFVLMPRAPRPGEAPAWLQTFETHHPYAAHRAIGVDTADGDTGAADEFRALGFEVFADTVMTAAQTTPPRRLNRDAEFRPLSGEADWHAALNLRLAVNAADAQGHDPEGYRIFAEGKLAALRRMQEAGRGAMFGAFSGGEMLSGLGLFDAGDGVARFQSVETHPQARSRGLAGTLLHFAAGWGQGSLGTRTLVIVADPGYHAQALYERLGFRPSEVQVALQRRG